LVCVAKHLCGGATDLSLTSALSRQDVMPVKGVAIATCCHHQCDLKTFCNIKVLSDEGKFTNEEIEILPRISSWAITQGKTSFEKAGVGIKVKRLIDYARIRFMEERLPNLKCGAFQYCDSVTESPECNLIVAY
jgi:hypothetical protein